MTKGAYCLLMDVIREIAVDVGALGRISFPLSRYMYVGSAMNGLEARIRRHIGINRGNSHVRHWHIDHLLTRPEVRIEAVYTVRSDERVECEIARALAARARAVRGFGSSDCRCESHLFDAADLDLQRVCLALGLEFGFTSELSTPELNKLNTMNRSQR